MKITLSKLQWELIGTRTGWIRTAKFGDQVKAKYLQQEHNENLIDNYINQFNEIRKVKPKALFKEIPGVNVPLTQRNNIEAYKDFHQLTLVVDYVNAQKPKAQYQEISEDEESNANIISKDDNLTIYRADNPQEAIEARGNWNYNWCVAASGNSNMFYNYRYKDEEPTFYFVEDPEDPEMPSSNKYHIFVLMVTENEYKVVSTENEGDGISMSWDQIVEIQPKLKDKQNLFVYIPVSQEEKDKYNNFKKITDKDFAFLSYKDKQLYIDMNLEINYEKFKFLSDNFMLYAINRKIYVNDEMYELIKDKPKLVNRLIEITSRKIKENPYEYNYPEEFKQHSQIQKAYLEGWINSIRKHPYAYYDCPEEFKQHNEIQKAYLNLEGWIEEIKERQGTYNKCPEELKQHSEIQKVYLEGWINSIKKSPYAYKGCPEELKQHAEIQKDALEGWIKIIRNNVKYSYPDCPEDLKQHPEIQKAHLEGWIKRIRKNPLQYQYCPEELKQHPEILELLPENQKDKTLISTFSNTWIKIG